MAVLNVKAILLISASVVQTHGKIGEQLMAEAAWPSEMRVSTGRDRLTIHFDSGEQYELSAELLRVLSPSAEVQGHSPDQRVTVGGKRKVRIEQMVPTGNYAVRIAFDDGHDTGIFTWAYLAQLGREKDQRWADYLDEIAEKKLTRD